MLFTIRNGSSLDSSIVTNHVFSELGGADIIVSQAFSRKDGKFLTQKLEHER